MNGRSLDLLTRWTDEHLLVRLSKSAKSNDLATVKHVLTGLFFLVQLQLGAQPNDRPLVFKSLTERDGLPHRNVIALHFDRREVLWLGTEQGLACYDAGKMTEIDLLPGELPPVVFAIDEDGAGALWLATSVGLMRLDPRTRDVQRWKSAHGPVQDELPDAFKGVMVGTDQHVYCAGPSGLFVFDPDSAALNPITVADGKPLAMDHLFLSDSANVGFWFGSQAKGLMYFDTKQGRLYHKDDNPAKDPLLDGIFISAMCTDAQGNKWFIDQRTGELVRYSPGDHRSMRWGHPPGHPELPLAYAATLGVDADGRIWANDWTFRPTLFDPADSSAQRVMHTAGDPGSIGGNFINELKADADGNTWFATVNGVSVLSPTGFTYTADPMSSLLNGRFDMAFADMQVVGDSAVWLCSELGLVHYGIGTRQGRKVHIASEDSGANMMLDLCVAKGELWLSTRDGLLRYDPVTDHAARFVDYPPEGEFLTHTVFAWNMTDATGHVWAGTWGLGAVRVDPRTGACDYFKPVKDDPDALPTGILSCGLVARDGTVWIGTGGKGLVRYDAATGHFVRYASDVTEGRLPKGLILTMKEDATGRLWLGVKNVGLVRFDPATRKYKVFGREQGLRIPSVGTILIDKLGRPWVGTNNELACFDPVRERFVVMPVEHGADYDDFNTSCTVLPNGEWLFANTNTLIRFDPLRFAIPAMPRTPALREVGLYGKRLPWLPGDTLLFDHQQDQLDLRFGTPAPPGSIAAYSYKLDGASREWTTGRSSVASFNNLLPGTYTLRMKVMDRWGTWSAEGSTVLTITPPWWRQLWFRALVALLIAAVVVLVFRLRLNRVRAMEERKSANERAMNELKLRALRAQMDPHFVFNCLNSIDSYILSNDPAKASHYLGRFAKLIRLILQHSDTVTVPLEREVEMLRYYLELEALRFHTPFTFVLKVDPLLNGEGVQLPTMLVQPYVENAIWHGLQHKEAPGRVEVVFRLSGDHLECTVEDDGIGREASRAINAGRIGVHRSMGMRVSADRLRLLHAQKQRTAEVTVHDLHDRTGAPLGTRVVITFPLVASHDEEQQEPATP
ncbi:MAG: histidine kinase [Flavobacteriales bacterium]